MDSSHLTPGTPDWEIAIRDAVARSYALLVVASPSASQSRYVRAEVALAEAVGRQVLPVWWQGAQWIDSIPLGLTYTQYIDLRDEVKAAGLRQLQAVLTDIVAQLTPIHYLVSPLRHFRLEGNTQYVTTTKPPRGYISIELPAGGSPTGTPPQTSEDAGRAALYLLSEFRTVSNLLDSLYINYVSDWFPPLTYGQRWLLREDAWSCGRVLADWLLFSDTETAGMFGGR